MWAYGERANSFTKSFELLNQSYTEKDDELTVVIRFPAFDALKSDLRWAALMQKLNLQP